MTAEDLNKGERSNSEKITESEMRRRFKYLDNKSFVKKLKDAGIKEDEIATLIHVDRDSFKEVKRASVWIKIEDEKKAENGEVTTTGRNKVKIVMITKDRILVRGKNIDQNNPSHLSGVWIENKSFPSILKITRTNTPREEMNRKQRSADELEKELKKD